jgi:hypothetical protein
MSKWTEEFPMHRFIFAMTTLLAFSAPSHQAAAQAVQPPAGSNWQHVQVLPVGTSINVKARTSHASCNVKSVDADSLTCTGKKGVVFQRTDVLSIGISHRGRSTAIGLGVGAGVGAGIGAGSCHDG